MSDTITGRSRRLEHPNWAPLEGLLPIRLCGYFMWMQQVELDDGTLVQAYKHIATRRYLHLDDDGQAYAYVPRSRYRAIERSEAIVGCFDGWESIVPAPDEGDLAALAEVRSACGDAA